MCYRAMSAPSQWHWLSFCGDRLANSIKCFKVLVEETSPGTACWQEGNAQLHEVLGTDEVFCSPLLQFCMRCLKTWHRHQPVCMPSPYMCKCGPQCEVCVVLCIRLVCQGLSILLLLNMVHMMCMMDDTPRQ